MKQVIFFLIFIFIITKANCQAIHFENLTWQQALSKAKQENKMLFVDVYTSWCTYCKQMEQTVFTNNETANFYNQHFINVQCNAQLQDGIQLRKSYALHGFPTFLYLDVNGIAIVKTAGYQQKETFIHNADSALFLQHHKIHYKPATQL